MISEGVVFEDGPLFCKPHWFSSRGVSLLPAMYYQMPRDLLMFVPPSALSLSLYWRIPTLTSHEVLTSI